MRLIEKILPHKSYESEFGTLEVVQTLDDDGRLVKVMRIGQSLQSATYTNRRWNIAPFKYIRAFDHMFEAEDGSFSIQDVLMIGGGGFSYPKHLLTRQKNISMHVVEIDKTVIEVAMKEFYLDRLIDTLEKGGDGNSLTIENANGMDYLAGTKRAFDVIINDSYKGEVADGAFLSEVGISLIRSHLKERGLYMSNIAVDLTREGARGLYGFMGALGRHFTNAYVINASDAAFGGADNYIVAASNRKCNFSDLVPYDAD